MIGRRIKDFRLAKGFTVKQLADLIGVSQGSLSDIENEKSKPSADTITSIVRNTDINPTWLLTGEGEMKRGEKGERPQIAAEPAVAYNVKDVDMQEIVGFLKENPVDKKVILKLIKSKKMAKEALEEFAGFKGLVEEG